MEFGVLGPLLVRTPDGAVQVGGARQRRLLSVLIAEANQVVSTDRLIEIVFQGEPPAGATTTIRSYVARLRRALADGESGNGQLIVTESPGYVLRVGVERIDAERFAAAIEAARHQLTEKDAVGAATILREGLALWRGEAYDEFAYEEWARAVALRLEEQRTVAEEELNEALLACGLAHDVVSESRRLIDEHPLRDRLRAQMALALYRSGRQVEALRSLEDYKEVLAEVGLEPSDDLIALGRSIAAHDPALRLVAPAGRPLRGYRLGAVVGEGRHGVVYRAAQPGVGREVAIKTIRRDLADDPEFIRRFDAEAQLVAHLEHPHVVPLYDYWREPGGAYIVMRLLSGNLTERLSAGPMDVADVALLAKQLGAALVAAHRAGVVHGDIKPSNVLVDAENAYLADFGVATLAGYEHRGGAAYQSSGYESPELLSGGAPGPASDQFALAVLLVQALVGTLPFGTRAIASAHDRVPSVHVQRSSVPMGVDEVLGKATSWEPADRYPDVGEFVDEFTAALGGELRPTPAAVPTANPYKGLRAFGEADQGEFFGRDAIVEELVAHLNDEGGAGRFIALVGASGSGKSSIVRAGLVPRLRSGAVEGSSDWFIATMVPGSRPFAELQAALTSIAVSNPGTPATVPDELEFARILRAATPSNQSVLLVVDQLEELFTAVSDESVRRAFLDGLAQATRDPDANLRVIATLRADFYDRPLRYHEFGRLVKAGTVTVVGMSATDLAQAVTEPAAHVGVEVESALATQIVADVVDQPASLPLLQFTLTELFERRSGRVLTMASYRELGGVNAAVARRADRVYESLSGADRELARRLFLRLVTVDDTSTASRRRSLRRELVSLAPEAGEMERVLDLFGDARLLAFDRDPASRAPTVEVAHEALILHWPRLAGWIGEAGEGLRIQGHMADSARAWDQQGRDSGELYRGLRLAAAVAWVAEHPEALNPMEQDYLGAGVELEEEEARTERDRAERQQRTNRRLRALLGGVGLVLVVALIAGFLAVDQRNEARRQQQVAAVGELAAASVANLPLDPELSVLLAREAVLTMSEAGVYVADAEEALHRAVLQSRALLSTPNWDNGLAHFSPDGQRFIGLTHPTDMAIPQVWDVETRRPLFDLVGHEVSPLDGVFSPDGARIATTSFDGTVRVWDAATGETETVLEWDMVEEDFPTIPVFNSDGSRLATSTRFGEVRIWDLDGEGAMLILPPPHEVPWAFNMAFSPDDTMLAVVYEEPTAFVWDTRSGELLQEVEHGAGVSGVSDVGFSLDGTRFVTGGRDGLVKVWDTESWENTGTFRGHADAVTDIEVSADGRVASGGSAGDVFVWDYNTFEVVHAVVGHDGDVDGIDISPDGRYLVTGSWTDTTTRLWDTSATWSHELSSVPGQVSDLTEEGAVSFSPDGETIASSSSERLVVVWEPVDGTEIATMLDPGAGALSSIDHSPDGRLVAAAGIEGAKVWEVQSGNTVATLFDGAAARDIEFHPDGTMLATATRDRGVELWLLPSGEPRILTGEVHGQAVGFSPDGSIIVVSYIDLFDREFGLDVLDLATGNLVASLPVGFQEGGEHNRIVTDMVFSPGGDRLVTVSFDGVGVVWDTATWKPVLRLEGHDGDVLGVAFDPIRNEVATASGDGTVKVWDLETGTVRLSFPGPAAFSSVSYSPDGRYLAAHSEGGLVQVFMLDLDELVEESATRLTRTWTDAECAQYLRTAGCV